MKKLGLFFFKYLNKLMTLIAVFWLGSSLFWLPLIIYRYKAMLTVTVSIILVVCLVFAYKKRPGRFRAIYDWAIEHKGLLTVLALIYQVILLISATMMIRMDAAVVFNGATKVLEELSISSYLTRNPNNMALFLYERFFYNLFGSATIWVLQVLNMVYVHLAGWLLYQTGKRHFNQQVADRTFLFYWLLILMTPKFMAMYTDILVLPLLAAQLYLLLANTDNSCSGKQGLSLIGGAGLISGLTILIRPTAVIVIIAFFMVTFLKNGWRSCLTCFLVFSLTFGASYGLISQGVKNQREVPLIEGQGLSKNLLTFINLGLTFSGTDQGDMQAGLATYLPEDQRDVYNNGRFHNDYQIAEIKRRLKAYNPWTFTLHTLYKQYLTTGQGNLNWSYKGTKPEKTSTMSPLTEWTEGNPLTQQVRDYLIYTDQDKFQYYDTFIQWVWILFSVGLVAFFIRYGDSPKERLLSLALFGGLLFLQIFEGGKSRYLIQFLPQILLISALGFGKIKGNKNK